MADVKQILVVDDHFEMLEFLRSMLELSSRDYQVLGVPSAEEAYLELRRMPFDLLITDVRLPGMSGFELVRRIRPLRPHMPILMITAYSSAQGKQEAAELGIYRYFQKPLDTEALLSSVRAALYELDDVPDLEPAVVEPLETKAADTLPEDVHRCLESLQTDTGAAQVSLATMAGDLLFESRRHSETNLPRLAKTVSASMETSFRLAEQLQSEQPFTIQYQAGERFDLYTANVGRDYFVMLLFDARLRRGRIGTVWIFAQRALRELLPLLAAIPTPAVATDSAPEVEETTEAVHEPPADESLTAAPLTELPPELQEHPLLDLLESESAGETHDLDAFWDNVLDEEHTSAGTGGLSLEEARRRGLIPGDLDSTEL